MEITFWTSLKNHKIPATLTINYAPLHFIVHRFMWNAEPRALGFFIRKVSIQIKYSSFELLAKIQSSQNFILQSPKTLLLPCNYACRLMRPLLEEEEEEEEEGGGEGRGVDVSRGFANRIIYLN